MVARVLACEVPHGPMDASMGVKVLDVLPLSHHDRDGSVVIHLAQRFPTRRARV